MTSDDDLLRAALAEDWGPGDLTTRGTVARGSRCRATLRAKSDGVLSGIGLFRRVFELVGSDIAAFDARPDGTAYSSGETVAEFSALTGFTLAAERTALNLLQRFSGTATLTRAFVTAVNGTGVHICDTRKTTPLWRVHQKAAVRHGGGVNHRFGLYDGILIKENHIVAAGSIGAAVRGVRDIAHHLLKIEVEVETLDQLDDAIRAQADAVLLDNMSLEEMKTAAAQAREAGLIVEASGNVTLDRVRSVAETGVHLISVGALTHSAPAADLSLRIEVAG